MKNIVLALTAITAFSNVALAQSSVSIYGIVDAGIVREGGGPGGSVTKLSSGVESGSRLGFRGTEDLGGGMSALFTLESGFNIDTGVSGQGGLLFGRQAWVGLQNKYGTATLGRQYTPLFLTINTIDPFMGCCLAGSSNNIISLGGIRMNNTIKYALPQQGGFNGEVAYGLGEVVGNNSAGRNIGADFGYTNGPLNIALAYHRTNNVPLPAIAPDNGRTTFVGGTYNFGIAKVALAYAINKGLITINNAAVAGTNSRDALIGVTVPFGNSKILASYIRKDDRTIANRDAHQMAIGYIYALSKRTDLYTSYARINNRAAPGASGFYTVGNASETGSGDKAFNVGVRHTF